MSGIFTISAIHLGHFAEIDTDEANISTENPEVLLGSHGAPGSPLYDQVSILTLDAGGDNLFGTDNLNSEPVSYDLGAGPVQTVFDTVAVLDATMHFVDGSAYAGVFYVAQDQFGEVFVLNASGEPDLSASAPIQFDVTGVSAHAGVSAIYDLKNSASSYTGYLCIAEGSEILTQRGPVPIELLRKGDLVMTLDSGMQPLLWIGRKGVMPCEEDPAVWIAADSLGPGMPYHDLRVSYQHAVLMRGAMPELCFGDAEVLARAGHLARNSGPLRFDHNGGPVVWYTLLFAHHEVIFANGALVESFYPGGTGLQSLRPAEAAQVLHLFPALRRDAEHGYGMPARRILRKWEAALLMDQSDLRGRENSRFSAPYCDSATPARISARDVNNVAGRSSDKIQAPKTTDQIGT